MVTPKAKQRVFLQRLAVHGVVIKACEESEMNREYAYHLRSTRPDFAKAWEDAIAVFVERAEAELHRRSIEGYMEPVYYRGELVGEIRKYSDRLLELLLKANSPEKYRERVDLNAKVTNVPSDIDAEVARLVEELRQGAGEDVPQES